MTNGDWVRSMTNNQLSDKLSCDMHRLGVKNRPRSRMIRKAEKMIRRVDND